jgi:hypothetical protein
VPLRRADTDPDRGPSDPVRVFRVLNAQRVDYVVIGGWAVISHGRVRLTNDVDFVVARGRENLARLERALRELSAELWGVDPHLLGLDLTAEQLGAGGNFTLTTDAGGVDVFNEVPGGAPYADLRRRSLEGRVRGISVRVASREDLIRMKRAAGREIDLEDLAVLTEGERASE